MPTFPEGTHTGLVRLIRLLFWHFCCMSTDTFNTSFFQRLFSIIMHSFCKHFNVQHNAEKTGKVS